MVKQLNPIAPPDGVTYGRVLVNTTAMGSLTNFGGMFAISPNELQQGDKFFIRAKGIVSNIATTPGTLQFFITAGAGLAICSFGAMPLNIVAKTDVHWKFEAMLTCLSAGASATFMSQGIWFSHSVIGSPAPAAGSAGACMLPYGALPAAGTAFDPRIGQLLDLQAQWSIADPANSILLKSFSVESMQ
jgi:hypothetical protein